MTALSVTSHVLLMTNIPADQPLGGDWTGVVFWSKLNTRRIVSSALNMGLYVAEVPWAYPGSRFTKDFDLTVAWFASYLPRSTTSYFMRVDWETVGRCVNRALHDLEPEHSRRLDSLVNIGIDETSYKKGHKYITVIVNHDTNTVVWASEDHGKSVLEKFYKQLTPEQLSSIKVVTGDGAKWITECVNEYTPDCAHCVDSFHVIEWAMTALDEVRKDIWHDAYSEYKQVKKDNPCSKGRPKKDDPELAIVKAAKAKADEIKGSAYMIKVLCFLFDTKISYALYNIFLNSSMFLLLIVLKSPMRIYSSLECFCKNEYNSFQNCSSYLGGIGYLINYIIFCLKYP